MHDHNKCHDVVGAQKWSLLFLRGKQDYNMQCTLKSRNDSVPHRH